MNNNNARRFEKHCAKDLGLSPLRVGAVHSKYYKYWLDKLSK
jgi:hypothetical protein